MDKQGFVILTHERNTPSMAKCARCEIKFFTPRELTGQPSAAEEFLWHKFIDHECKVRQFPSFQKRAVNQ